MDGGLRGEVGEEEEHGRNTLPTRKIVNKHAFTFARAVLALSTSAVL